MSKRWLKFRVEVKAEHGISRETVENYIRLAIKRHSLSFDRGHPLKGVVGELEDVIVQSARKRATIRPRETLA